MNIVRGFKKSFNELFKRYDIIIIPTIKYKPALLPKAGITITGKKE